MVHVKLHYDLDVPAARIWEILSDFGGIADWAEDLAASELVSGNGLEPGATRVCTYPKPVNGQASIKEVLVEVGDMSFHYEIPEGLRPYQRGWSKWRVEDLGAAGCRVHFETRLLHGGFMGWLFSRAARRAIRAGIRKALSELGAYARARTIPV